MANENQLLIRHEARSPKGQAALQHYAAAVGTMKEREPADPTSWAYQAAIHGTKAPSPLALQRQCEHESWFFFPWHRIYLYYFEQIVRKAVVDSGGPADWTLPYWNYDLGGEHASLPTPFLQPADKANPLFVPVRSPYYNAGGPLPALVSTEEAALSLRVFTGNAMFGGGNLSPPRPHFWGQKGLPEVTPHGTVHVEVAGWMQNPDEAAQDPIFWLHHANIDRIWAVWNEREGNANPPESGWTSHPFEFFDADGKPVAKRCGEVNGTSLLGYTYDPPPGGTVGEVTPTPPQPPPQPPGAPSEPKFVGATAEPFSLRGEETEISMEIDARAREEVLAAADPDDPRHLYVNAEEIRGETTPDTVYAMYLNLPRDPRPADYESHYLTSLSFFGLERTNDPAADEAPHGMRVSTEVTRLIEMLRDDTDWDREQLRLRFRPVVPEPSAEMPDAARELLASSRPAEHAPIEIGRISLSIDA
jgi:tyrosinase